MGKALAVIVVLVLIVLHNDTWHQEPQLEPVGGGIPADMAYHLLWLVGASVGLAVVMRVTWKRAP